ncbi:SCP-like protein [Ancylostoma ceylanicum]|uniref:SCP-like protein n=1 Tax=Ancylostoma ceylanicum TaxID=53326 RepID=A0A0D6LEB6_9BILA|nr:SCP-like protein [Ancylostoma ceylanicum]
MHICKLGGDPHYHQSSAMWKVLLILTVVNPTIVTVEGTTDVYNDAVTSRNFGINAQLYEPTWDKNKACESCADCTNYLCPQKSFTPVTITPTCQDDKLNQDSNNAALWMHNYYRGLLASGWAKDKKSNSGYAKTAKQMRALEYDCGNATNPNGATNTYNLIKDCPRVNPTATNGYSLNFLRIDDYQISEQDALERAIKTWWGQLETMGLGSDTMFNENSGITNFANMAYDQAEKVACAVQNCAKYGDTLVACQYNKAIQSGDKIYETGKVCSGCKAIRKTCSNPRGLCV